MTTSHRLVRQYLVEELRKDFVGPGALDEELHDRPTVHYLTGILYPQEAVIDRDEDDDSNEAPEDDDDIDPGTLMAMATNPSSIGMTFLVGRHERVRIELRSAIYIETPEVLTARTAATPSARTGDLASGVVGDPQPGTEPVTTDKRAGQDDPAAPGRNTRPRSIWQRRQLDLLPVEIDSDIAVITNSEQAPGLKLYIRCRPREDHNVITISLLNINTTTAEAPEYDALCFFQPEITVSSPEPGRAIFMARPQRVVELVDEDRGQSDLLYRHVPEFAVGHGCATTWEAAEYSNASLIRTVIIPDYEIRQLSPDRLPPIRACEMLFLSEATKDELEETLQQLVTLYQHWIDEQRVAAGGLSVSQRQIADANLEQCSKVASRMARGIELIGTDALVRRAFQLANRAMLIQRARAEWVKMPVEGRPNEPTLSSQPRWRPFQLAFFLLCLTGIVDPDDPTRALVDLLWFPTGGGKTEAYLGLTAFTIFLRRLRAVDKRQAAGVTVLMRYTLRLLTLQQFQRAAILIMACESIRRQQPAELGDIAISLGLWVGAGATPNTLEEAGKALKNILKGERVFESNPYQVRACPWCGTRLTPRDYRIGVTLTIMCPNLHCEFSRGMPLYLVDDDIYRIRPSLLIGTVDKFARLPWKGETAALFGRPQGTNLPPELIIQDELHLISGPLGTMVGLYEVAIDALCTRLEIPPKIIASTATIRRAREQCEGLFARGLGQFPPSGIDARDSFFAQEAPADERPGRLYVGIHTPGKSMKTALLRIYALLQQKIHEHRSENRWKDPYWTLVGYFNSLRELGGAVRLVDDDVRARIRVLARRTGAGEREIKQTRELNSRISSDEIPQVLELMATTMDNPSDALDVLLATNMISVGVDVDRLGLMVVTGQPKMSSEYIQATSRIGRQYPGLVITLYNWTRPRDRSHYERFVGYHSAIYSHVEPTSVTPFAGRARDRGLHAAFIAMLRHLSPSMNAEDAAALFDPDSLTVETILERLHARVTRIDPDEVDPTMRQLRAVIERWEALKVPTLTYGRPKGPHLMEAADSFDPDSYALPTLNSLRGVEGESGLFFAKRSN